MVDARQEPRPPSSAALTRRLGLAHVAADTLCIRRQKCGRGWTYLSARGAVISDPATRDRLNKLAVPPAYEDVLYSRDPKAHLQAIGRDAAGRLQYRYHPEWQKVREVRKSRRLARIAEALPRIRRRVGQILGEKEPSKSFALAAVIEVVACSAIRPGSESHARLRGTRGAATLLKSNVTVSRGLVTLSFKAKGGKRVVKEFTCPRVIRALARLRHLPGARMFQYRNDTGEVRFVTAPEVNAFLREIAGVRISLKDFRTLLASASALEKLAHTEPAASERGRRRQVMEVVRETAEDLANTPAICRTSYVHATVVTAFEQGKLKRFSERLKATRSPARRAQVLAEVIAGARAA